MGKYTALTLAGAIQQARATAKNDALSAYLAELESLYLFLLSPVFRLSVVSENAREMAALAGALLDRELYTDRVVPVTVRQGPEMVIVQKKDGTALKEGLPYTGSGRQDIAELTFLIDQPWLAGKRLQIRFCPQAELTAATLADALIWSVPADAGLSLGNRRLLTEMQEKGKSVRVLVLATGISRVPAAEREELAAWLTAAVRQAAPAAELAWAGELTLPAERAKLRGLIESWCRDEQQPAKRLERTTGQFSDMLGEMAHVLAGKMAERSALQGSRDQDTEKMRLVLQEQRVAWLKVKALAEQGKNECNERTRELSDGYGPVIVAKLSAELSITKNPKEWWEKVSEYKINTELKNCSRELESKLQGMVRENSIAIKNLVRQRFNQQIGLEKHLFKAQPAVSGQAPSVAGRINWQDLKVTARTLFMIAGGAISFAFPPVGLFVGAVGFFASEKVAKAQAEKQGAALQALLEPVIGPPLTALKKAAAGETTRVYGEIMAEINALEKSFVEKQEGLIERMAYEPDRQLLALQRATAEIFDLKNSFLNL